MKRYNALFFGATLTGSILAGSAVAAEPLTTDQIVEQLTVTNTRSLGSQGFGQSSNESSGRVNLPAIQFEYNSAQLKSDAREQVDMLGAALQQMPNENFHIVGHTDASGSDSYNMSLSQRRAKTVFEYLISEYGIDKARLVSTGEGENKLLDEGNPKAAENRRVEIINSLVAEE